MKPGAAAAEIVALLEEAERLGGSKMSPELSEFLRELADSGGLKKSARRTRGTSTGGAGGRVPRPPRDEATMSKTIDELAAKLQSAFASDTSFEEVMNEPVVQKLSKPNVVVLFNRVFRTHREFPKSLTKPDLFNAIRRERVARVRGSS